MKDLKELDKIFRVENSGGKFFYVYRKVNDIFSCLDGWITPSEAVELINKGDKRIFAGGSTEGLETFIVAKQLNDFIKKPSLDMYTSMFGNLSHLITKELITIPEDFTSDEMKHAKSICDATNEVFWLKPFEGAALNLEMMRRDLKRMLENNTTFDIQDILTSNN